MRRAILLSLCLTAIAAPPAHSATFDRARIAPDLGLDAMTRSVSRAQVNRDLFANPYATVTVGSVDVYDAFPYVESRTFQIVSDPRWNRLVFGEMGRTLRAFDGKGSSVGALSDPHGMTVDEQNRVYVADTGNDRIVVFQVATEFDQVTLVPQYAITGLSRPYDVAFSDNGTPFVAGDDWLYVADTGKNRVVAYALEAGGPRLSGTIGALGSGVGAFAGPMAITVGRAAGANTNDLYVADAHTQRLVHLKHDTSGFAWVGDAKSDADIVTSLDTDQWGNLYATAPNRGVVRKLTSEMAPLAELHSDLARPRSFRLPFVTVRDHRTGRVTREGRPSALSIEQWSDASGMRLWNLGVDVPDLAVVAGSAPGARFTLTDRADVSYEIIDVTSGRSIAHRSLGTLDAGAHTVLFEANDLAAAAGTNTLVLRVSAASSYANGPTAQASTAFRADGGAVSLPGRAMLLGSWPNPVVASTRITFVLPAGPAEDVSLKLFDSEGRVVRRFAQPFAAGLNQVVWDGTNERGALAPPGVYFFKLRTGDRQLTQRLALVR